MRVRSATSLSYSMSNSSAGRHAGSRKSHAASPVLFGEAPDRPVFPLSPLKDEGDGAPRGATTHFIYSRAWSGIVLFHRMFLKSLQHPAHC